MERLTEIWNDRYIALRGRPTLYSIAERKSAPVSSAIARLAAYEDAMPLERARELAQAEKGGRLVVLPYKIGDLVYRIAVREKYLNHSMSTPYIKAVEIKIENAHKYINEIGKTVFLTREEAEAALKKREDTI